MSQHTHQAWNNRRTSRQPISAREETLLLEELNSRKNKKIRSRLCSCNEILTTCAQPHMRNVPERVGTNATLQRRCNRTRKKKKSEPKSVAVNKQYLELRKRSTIGGDRRCNGEQELQGFQVQFSGQVQMRAPAKVCWAAKDYGGSNW